MDCAVASMHWEQDEADRLTLASRRENGVTVTQRYVYRAADDPDGALGLLRRATTTLSGAAAGTVQSINYTYLPNGQRDSMEISTPQGGTLEYVYTSAADPKGKLGRIYGINRVAGGGGKTRIVTYSYDAGGRVRSETCPETFQSVFRDYDIKGRVRRIRGGAIDVEYTYDTLDRRVKVEYHHMHVVWFYDYDDLGRLTHETCTGNAPGSSQAPAAAIAARGPGNTSPLDQCELATARPGGVVPMPAYEYAFDYDDVGNRTAKRWVSGAQVFGSWRYEYNGPTNFLTDAYGLGGRHITYTPDARGNQKTRSEQSVLETYDFDEANRVTSYFRQDGASVRALETYVHAPDGERIAVVDTTDPGARVEKWYAFDGADVVADMEWTSANPILDLKSTYVNGLGVDDKIARFEGASSSATAYYRRDALGSIITTTDGRGQVVNSYATNAWGEDILPRPTDNANRYGFAGRENDEKSGLMHFRARGYDPATGRFLQNDPILGNRASEGYAYASGQPTGLTDPMGTDADDMMAGQVDLNLHVSTRANLFYRAIHPSGRELGLGAAIDIEIHDALVMLKMDYPDRWAYHMNQAKLLDAGLTELHNARRRGEIVLLGRALTNFARAPLEPFTRLADLFLVPFDYPPMSMAGEEAVARIEGGESVGDVTLDILPRTLLEAAMAGGGVYVGANLGGAWGASRGARLGDASPFTEGMPEPGIGPMTEEASFWLEALRKSEGSVLAATRIPNRVLAEISWKTTYEVGLFRVRGGGFRLTLGDEENILLPLDATWVEAHTHMSGRLSLSLDDLGVLRLLRDTNMGESPGFTWLIRPYRMVRPGPEEALLGVDLRLSSQK